LFVVTLSLSQDIDMFAQTTSPCGPSEPNCDNSRFFQMALLTYPHFGQANWTHTVPYVDIPAFASHDPIIQPPGRSIMLFENWYTVSPSALPVDWSRILAVVIDEPYATRLVDDLETEEPVAINPCDEHFGEWNEPRRESLEQTRGVLDTAVDALHSIAPRARVWLNFHQYEVAWMRGDDCVGLNDPDIDVVSLDHYEVNFSSIQDEYAWFASEWPQQQLALVPGTHQRIDGGDTAEQAAARLQDYFDYANSMNQPCDPADLGRVGRTGNYDGCRVWIVAGWLPDAVHPVPPAAPLYYGLLHSSSAPIAEAWLDEFHKVRRSWRRTLSDGELGVILQLTE
jgi:hypothetical protein